MPDPKIKVSADMSAVTSEMAKLEAAAARINKTLSGGEVGIDVKRAKADLSSLNDAAKAVADSLTKIRGAGSSQDVGYGRVAKALDDAARAGESLEQVLAAVGQSTNLDRSIRASKAVADNLERARRAQEILTREGVKLSREDAVAAKRKFDEWRASGARGTAKLRGSEFDEWLGGGWRKYSIDFEESERNRRKVMRSVGVMPPEESMSRRSRGWGMGRLGGTAMGALGGVAGSILTGGEGFFGAMGAGGGALLGAAAGTVFGPGIGTVAGAAAGATLGAVGGIIDQSMRRVLATAETFTDLRHSIGETTTDFDKLRGYVQSAVAGYRITNEEAAKLARTFADAAGTTRNEIELAQGVRGGAGLARGYGLAPAAGIEFYGSMLRMGVSGNNEQNKRLALMIGEAVARNGVAPQFGAVLRAVQNFADVSTRASFTQANAAGYAEYLSRMMGTGLAGAKDVGAVTSAMTAADAALRQGGGFGLASKVFSLGMYQRMLPGFNAFDLNIMNAQGAFGTVGGAFGPGSPAYRQAQQRGDKGAMERYSRWAQIGGNKPVLQLQLEQLERTYPNVGYEQFIMYMQNQLGLSAGQAQEVYAAYKAPGGGLGKLQTDLQRQGIPLEKVNPAQIGALAAVESMGRPELQTLIANMLKEKNLPANVRGALQNAQKAEAGGDVEQARQTVLKITALTNLQKDQGETLKEQAVNIQNMTDAVVQNLVPITSAIQQAVLAILTKMGGGKEAASIGQSLAKARIGGPVGGAMDRVQEALDREIGSAAQHRKVVEDVVTSIVRPSRRAGGHPDPAKMSGSQRANMAKIMGWAKQMGATDDEVAAVLGVAWRDDKFASVHGRAKPGTGDRPYGLFQVMDSTAAGWGLSHHSEEAQKRQIGILLDQYRRHGGARAAGTAQLSGPGNVGPGGYPKRNRRDYAGVSTGSFAEDVVGFSEDFKKILQEGGNLLMPGLLTRSAYGRGAQQAQQVDVRHQITLIDRYGNPIPNAVVNTTTLGSPQPAGTN